MYDAMDGINIKQLQQKIADAEKNFRKSGKQAMGGRFPP